MAVDISALDLLPAETQGLFPCHDSCGWLVTCDFSCLPSCTNTCKQTDG